MPIVQFSHEAGAEIHYQVAQSCISIQIDTGCMKSLYRARAAARRPRARPAPARVAPAVGTVEEAVVEVAGVLLLLPTVVVAPWVTVTTGVDEVARVVGVTTAVVDFLVVVATLTLVLAL